jgi:hypothetical protein
MNSSDPQVKPVVPARYPAPGWWSTWAGLWGMTWRSVWSTRRWPVLTLLIFASPVLAWLALRFVDVDLPAAEDPSAVADPRVEWLQWVTSVHFGLVIPLWCLIAFGSFIRDEVQSGTIGFMLTRPLTRPRFLLVRWLCTLTAVQVPLALNTILLGVSGLLLGISDAFTLTVLLLGAQWFVVPAYGAIAAFLGLLTRKYLLLGLVYGFVVEVGIGQIPTNINTLSVARHFRTLLEQFDGMTQAVAWSAGDLWRTVGLLMVLTLVYLGAATMLFSIREYNQSEETR